MTSIPLSRRHSVLRSKKAVEAFYPIGKITIGSELAVALGPYGAGASAEAGTDRTPVFSYVRSRGFYAGIEILANAFICRFDENERVYHWNGITQKDVVSDCTAVQPNDTDAGAHV